MKYMIEVEIPDGETIDVQKPGLRFKGFVYVKAEQVEDVPDTNVGDLISRHSALAVFNGAKVDEGYCSEYEIGYNDGIDFAVSSLSVLPSINRLTEVDLIELEDRFGKNVRMVVEDMLSGEGKRWIR